MNPLTHKYFSGNANFIHCTSRIYPAGCIRYLVSPVWHPALTLLLLLTISNLSLPQVVYTPSVHYVYEFLERLSLKKVIEYHNEVKPASRKNIADLLRQASLKKDELNPVELQELDWLFEEYAHELGTDSIKQRWFLYSYSDSLFSVNISPVLGYGISGTGKYSGHSQWWGLDMFTTHSNWFGASLNGWDRGEYGENVDTNKNFSPLSATKHLVTATGVKYGEIDGSISFNWDWGHISLIKGSTVWGHGNFGQLILSEKAPSFPFIRFDLYPAEWLRFYYIHGWLNSLVYDSSAFSLNHLESGKPFLKKEYINKYIVANLLSISIFPWFDFSAGNSIVYSGNFKPEYFIPFLLFKQFDNRDAIEDGNQQLFLDAMLKYFKSSEIYFTLFIDVAEFGPILRNDFHSTWTGFTLGGKKIDLFMPMLDFAAEYTRISPWVYEHKDESASYKNYNYYLGHWLGQNADQLRLQFDYRPLRGLKLKAYTEFIRKGRLNDIFFAYNGNQTEPFLSSPLRTETRFSFEASYEIIHDFFAEAFYTYSDVSDEDLIRTPLFLLGKKHSFAVYLHYGL